MRLTGNATPSRKERTMTYAYENHVPSRAEIVIGMAADAIRRWRDRREERSVALPPVIAGGCHADQAVSQR